MAFTDYNRYELLTNDDGTISPMPFVNIPLNPSDKYENWIEGSSRLDKLSYKYYGNPTYDWLIELANPQFLNQWEFQENFVCRIPFPLNTAISYFESGLKKIISQ